MEPNEDSFLRFCRFIRYFQCAKVPCDLLIRACEPKLTWTSNGEIVQKLPLEAGVPEWLMVLYNTNKPFLHHPTHGSHIAGVEIILQNGVPYFDVATANQPELELNQLPSIDNEGSMAGELLAVFLQAFPSINIEIIGEEIVDRLMDIAMRSILPLLSCLTDADIKDWLLPIDQEELESCLFSLFEFLYQAIAMLGVEHPLLPLSLPERLLNIVPDGTGNDTIVVLRRIADILKQFKETGQDVLEYKPLSSGTKTDERSHSILGYFLSLPNMHSAGALTTWQPLVPKSPSQMEYLAAVSFCEQSRLAVLERPAFLTLDVRVLEGLLRSRRKQYDQASKVLDTTMVEVISQYGSCSMQLGIVTAELANCYNVLRREALAELTLTKSLELLLDSDLSNRRDVIYLRFALADSLIGQAKYQDAVPILQGIIDDPDVSATFRMMSALRLTRSKRRMHEDARKAFQQKSPLWIGFSLLDNVPDVLVMEYVEELGCSISELPKRKLEDSKNTQELIEAVNSALSTSSSVTNNPCWEWYTKCQEEYSGQITEATKENKGKGVDEVLGNELPPQSVDDMSVDEGPCLNSIMLGSLRMSVDHAIDSFIKFGNTVLGRPRLFHSTSPYFPSRTKYPAADVRKAFQNIITDSIEGVPGVADVPGWGLSGHKAIFHEKSGGIRTIVFSCRLEDGIPYAWKSYHHQEYTRIWEVACATVATPGYFDAIEIDGAAFVDGAVFMNNPSFRALEEVLAIHTKIPAVFVNIGTGTQYSDGATFRRWRDRLQQSNILFDRTVKHFQTGSETKRWIEFARHQGLKNAYTLSAGKDLQAIPHYDWQPADTGKKTLHEITRITEEYLRCDEVRATISIIAHEAVQIRRARAITEKWRSFIQPPAVNPPSALSSVGYDGTVKWK
ncbi:guanine nucleotide-binding alpha-3 subunit [Fusarium tjaetaba]|uniref:Guanine nucleotide-binding alpha-3 subunit n=1 Tax=Fusarium tjaetaba TaxID=1567544 RepID=A0A8H5VQQ6_9HYPO|nr:guanine nucleotide-binding alpha-3 subunit [Fusarium tjaetaba]KAF5633872.1 guanine nucleotide-binding alpha-3 subunit [Fusarium tjaetaba]